jgi:hypothetical protein
LDPNLGPGWIRYRDRGSTTRLITGLGWIDLLKLRRSKAGMRCSIYESHSGVLSARIADRICLFKDYNLNDATDDYINLGKYVLKVQW